MLRTLWKHKELSRNEIVARKSGNRTETEDELIRDMLLSSAGQINAVGGVNGDNPTELTASDIAGAGATLFNANAYTIADKIEGQNKFGTSPRMNGRVKSSLIDLEALA